MAVPGIQNKGGVPLPLRPESLMQTTANLLNGTAAELCECFERLSAEKLATVPLSTYRLQFNNRFHFEQARQLIPYLQKLGITHLYSSPILKAREGSQHGYDIIDHNQVNPRDRE